MVTWLHYLDSVTTGLIEVKIAESGPGRAAAHKLGRMCVLRLRVDTLIVISYFKTNPEIIRRAVILVFRFPLSLRNVDDLHEHGFEISRETTNRIHLDTPYN